MLTAEFDKMLAGLVNSTRMADYGHPADHFQISAAIKAEIRANFKGDPRLLHALEMLADKMARLCHSPDHFDSWLDIAGYARTAVMVLDRITEEKRNENEDNRSGTYTAPPADSGGQSSN